MKILSGVVLLNSTRDNTESLYTTISSSMIYEMELTNSNTSSDINSIGSIGCYLSDLFPPSICKMVLISTYANRTRKIANGDDIN